MEWNNSFIKLSAGSYLFNSLNQLQMLLDSNSFLISAVGDLSKVDFKCPVNEKKTIKI